MRCIFCKEDSANSKSVEHIVPESLGGTNHTLPVGIVCDKCNNYFSHEIEKPFLEEPYIKQLRFEQEIESKKGRIPPITGLLNNQFPVNLGKDVRSNFTGYIDIDDPLALNSILSNNNGTIVYPMLNDNNFLKSDVIVTRFIGKIAIEALAERIINSKYPDVSLFINDSQYDFLRNHVRRGIPKNWQCAVRRIYDTNKLWVEVKTNENYQILNEYDFLITEESELYFILALFGMEYVINMGEPYIDGYKQWLRNNNGRSYLYDEKNLR